MSKYPLGGSTFRTKSEIKQYIRALRESLQIGEVVTPDPVLLALYEQHPEWQQKSQGMTGIGAAFVDGYGGIKSKQIVLMRADQPPMDISWVWLVDNLKPGGVVVPPPAWEEAVRELRLCARAAIEDQVKPLQRNGFEVDHVAPNTFEVLLYRWVTGLGVKVTDIHVTATDGLEVRRTFTEPSHHRDWCAFHAQHAQLVAVPKAEHAKRPKVKVSWEALV
jgi:hypothetical protein